MCSSYIEGEFRKGFPCFICEGVIMKSISKRIFNKIFRRHRYRIPNGMNLFPRRKKIKSEVSPEEIHRLMQMLKEKRK